MGFFSSFMKAFTDESDTTETSNQTNEPIIRLEHDPNADDELNQKIDYANQNNDAGTFISIGLDYEEGNHVSASKEKALQCYKIAADMGNADACYLYGTAIYDFDTGEGLEESGSYLKKAARAGHVPSMYKLGMLYVVFDYGFGKGKGYDWWEKAAKLGNANAQAEVGIAYGQGVGYVDQADHKKACFWCTCAYLHGKGSAKNKAEQYLQWACQNVPGAKNYVDSLMKSIPQKYPQYLKD